MSPCNFCDNEKICENVKFSCDIHSNICILCIMDQICCQKIKINCYNENEVLLICECGKKILYKIENFLKFIKNSQNFIKIRQKKKCKLHCDSDINAYCKKCKMEICQKCEKHINHKTITINELIDNIIKNKKNLKYKTYGDFENFITESEKKYNGQISQELKETTKQIDKVIKILESSKREYEKKINSKKQKMHFHYELIKGIHQYFYSCIDNISSASLQTLLAISKSHVFESTKVNINHKNLIYSEEINSVISNSIFSNEPKIDLVFKKFLPSKIKRSLSKQLSINKANKDSVSTSPLICTHTLNGHSNSIYCLIELSSGKIASCSSDTKIIIWNNTNYSIDYILQGHTQRVNCLVETPSGKLISTSADYTIKIWNLLTQQVEHTLNHHNGNVSSCALLPGNRLASSSWDATLIVWNLSTLKEEYTFQAQANSIGSLVFIGNNKLCSSIYRSIAIWNFVTKRKEDEITNGHDKCINCIVLLKDKVRIASASDDKTIKVWEISTKKCLCTLNGHDESIYCVIELNDGNLCSGSQDKSLRIWSMDNKKEIACIFAHKYTIRALIQLKTGIICTGSWDSTVKMWIKNLN